MKSAASAAPEAPGAAAAAGGGGMLSGLYGRLAAPMALAFAGNKLGGMVASEQFGYNSNGGSDQGARASGSAAGGIIAGGVGGLMTGGPVGATVGILTGIGLAIKDGYLHYSATMDEVKAMAENAGAAFKTMADKSLANAQASQAEAAQFRAKAEQAKASGDTFGADNNTARADLAERRAGSQTQLAGLQNKSRRYDTEFQKWRAEQAPGFFHAMAGGKNGAESQQAEQFQKMVEGELGAKEKEGTLTAIEKQRLEAARNYLQVKLEREKVQRDIQNIGEEGAFYEKREKAIQSGNAADVVDIRKAEAELMRDKANSSPNIQI